MSDIYNILTSDGNKTFLNIKCNSVDAEHAIEAESINIASGEATVGLVNFTNLPLAPSPLVDHTIMICDSTDNGRPTINNGSEVHKLQYVDDIPITFADRIVSPDLSSSVICQNGGTVQTQGQLDLNNDQVINLKQITASTAFPLNVIKSNTELTMDTDLVSAYIGGNSRLNLSSGSSQLIGPDLFSSVKALNDTVVMSTASNGSQIYSDTSETFIKYQTEKLTLQSGKVTSTVPIVLPSNQLVSNPDLQWVDSSNTGLYSSSTGKVNIACEGLDSFQISKNGVSGTTEVLLNDGYPQQMAFAKIEALEPSGPCLVDFISYGAQSNIALARGNGTVSAPTKVLNGNSLGNLRCQGWSDAAAFNAASASVQFKASEDFTSASHNGGRIEFYTAANGSGILSQRMTLENTGFLGIGQAVPAAKLDINGSSGQTLKIVDTNQGAGKVLTSDASGVASWSAPGSIQLPIGYLYYEGPVNSGANVPGMVALSTKYLVDIPTSLGTSINFDSPSNCRLRYIGSSTKVFTLHYTISATNDDGGSDARSIYFYIYKNGVQVTGSSRSVTLGSVWFSVSACITISLTTNDYVELYISNESSSIVSSAGVQIGTLQFVCS